MNRFDWDKIQPVYRNFDGWEDDIRGTKNFGDLPQEARDYVLQVEKLIERNVRLVSVGPKAEDTIIRN